MALRMFSTALMAVALTACSSSSPTAPAGPLTPAAATYEGVWTITYTVAECGGFRQCVHYRGDSRTISLHVTPVGGGYEGVVQLEPHLQVSVSGALGADGRLTLKGIRRAVLADDYETEIEALTLPALGDTEPSQGGVLRFATRGPNNAQFVGTALTAGPITSAELTGPLSGPVFSGKWTGNFPGNNCVSHGWPHCFPFWEDTTYRLTLDLTQTGGVVSGTLGMAGGIAVTGTVAGATVRLSGSGGHVGSGVNVAYAVESDGLVLDRIGRLTGSLRFVATYDWHDGRGTWTVSYPAIPLSSVARSLR